MFSPAVDKTIEEILNLRIALRRFAAAQPDPVVRYAFNGLATACASREDPEFRRGRHEAKLSLVTHEMPRAGTGAVRHCTADRAASGLGPGVFLPPGTFGSVVFAEAAKAIGNRAEVAFAETVTLPWLTRKCGPFEVAITIRAKRLPTGVFPLRLLKPALSVIGPAFPGVIEPCGNALSGALMNAGAIIHPPLIPLEYFDRWDIHKEGTQPVVHRVTDALDGERIAAREALGYGPPHFPLADHSDRTHPR